MLNAQHSFTMIDAETAISQPVGKWKYFVIGACELSDELKLATEKLRAGGCKIIWYAPDASVFSAPDSIPVAQSPEELLAYICPAGSRLVATGGTTDGILWRENENCVLLVNSKNETKPLCYNGSISRLVDPRTKMEYTTENNSFTLDAYGTLLLYK